MLMVLNISVSCFLSSSLLSSILPSVMMLSDVLTRANRVALKLTVPSGLSLMFIETSRLQATLWGHNFPNPSGGEIFLSRVTTSTCLIRPLASGSYSDQRVTNSPRWWGPRMDQSLVK